MMLIFGFSQLYKNNSFTASVYSDFSALFLEKEIQEHYL